MNVVDRDGPVIGELFDDTRVARCQRVEGAQRDKVRVLVVRHAGLQKDALGVAPGRAVVVVFGAGRQLLEEGPQGGERGALVCLKGPALDELGVHLGAASRWLGV